MAIDTAITNFPAAPAAVPLRQPAAAVRQRPRRTGRVSRKDMIFFCSQLSLMLDVGTSLTDAVKALQQQTANPNLRAVLRTLERDMEEGQSFSSALARHPAVFDGVLVSMVRAGEAGGYLRDALERIVEMGEKREALLAHVRAALTYPIILAVVALAVVTFVLTGVLPKFMPLFAGKEDILPLSTRMLMSTSHSLITYWWAWGLGLAGLVGSAMAFIRSAPGRKLCDRLSLVLPVIGPLTNKVLTGQLLRTLGHLLESHVALLDALKVARLTLRNCYYRALLDRVASSVEGGGRLSLAFQEFAHMPPTVRQMVATGEEAGNVYQVMLRLARHYDQEIEQNLKRVASLIEPAALIILGGIVGLIVASVILPLFKMAHAVG